MVDMAAKREIIIMELPQSLPTKKCKKCEHEWVPRVPRPQRCSKCLSYDWDKEVKEDNKE